MKILNKDQALVEMITKNSIMCLANPIHSKRYFTYSQGVFFVSDSPDFVEYTEWNPNHGSPAVDWIIFKRK